MTTPANLGSGTVAVPSATSLLHKLKARIDSLSYLPTTAGVAIKFVELGKNPEAEPADYAKVIQADSSLSSKLLALANSSWAGVRNKVTNVRMAVNLLGLGTVRTLAISYCMAGLHNELRLTSEEAEAFWESSLSKAVAAKRYAALFDNAQAEEAFVAGLFQDFAMPVMYAVDRQYVELLRDPTMPLDERLHKEREHFGMDHAEVGRMLAQRLELPEIFVDAIAFHHDASRLGELIASAPLRDGTAAAALLPHAFQSWSPAAANGLVSFLRQHAPATDIPGYVNAVQKEFSELYAFFNEGQAPPAELAEMLIHVAQEVADNTTQLVGAVNEFMRDAASLGQQVQQQVQRLETEATGDPLTAVLNRHGLRRAAAELLTRVAKQGVGLAVLYLDIDKFKQINDRLGHAFGDLALQKLAADLRAVLPGRAVIGRQGGDEFVALLDGCSQLEANELAKQIVERVAEQAVCQGPTSQPISVSVGLLYVRPSSNVQSLDALLGAVDKLMYRAKQAGGNQLETRAV